MSSEKEKGAVFCETTIHSTMKTFSKADFFKSVVETILFAKNEDLSEASTGV